jgi:hypothetical protein
MPNLFKTTLLSAALPVLLATAVEAQSVDVTGKVTDAQGNPIASASVRVKDSRLGVSSDSLGIFKVKAKHKDSLIISAIGYGDTIVLAGSHNPLAIVLQHSQRVLGEAVVSGGQNPGLPNPEQATRNEIISTLFQQFDNISEFSNGTYVASDLVEAKVGNITEIKTNITRIDGFGPLNTINSGAVLPEVRHQEDTRGSRYLLKEFASGVIVDNNNHILTDSLKGLNYDKIDGQLLIAQGGRNYLEVDKDKVIGFAFKNRDTSFVFVNVPILSKVNYFVVVANGPKYSVYKSVRTRFVKANYTNNGLVETGNNYDEYVDKETYFWVEKNDSAGVFELKKKSIKEAFAGEKAKVDTFFSQHKYDDIDEAFIRGLILFLNKS